MTTPKNPGIAERSNFWQMCVLAVMVAGLLSPVFVFAQNCALCYTQAAGSGSRMIHALKSGILILMIPPMAICIGLTVMAYRKRNQFNEDFQNDE
jgi:heme/copper-type cytochrome/quinol oxidase subunit 2